MLPSTWEIILLFGSMLSFIITAAWNLVSYFLKKKDKTIDLDHEAISSIKGSIIEVRNAQKLEEQSITSIKISLEHKEKILIEHNTQIRNIEEALRRIELFHEKQHREFMNLFPPKH